MSSLLFFRLPHDLTIVANWIPFKGVKIFQPEEEEEEGERKKEEEKSSSSLFYVSILFFLWDLIGRRILMSPKLFSNCPKIRNPLK